MLQGMNSPIIKGITHTKVIIIIIIIIIISEWDTFMKLFQS
jgi:hypothetical protein